MKVHINKSDLTDLCSAVQKDISDEYRASDDPEDDTPGTQLNIACNADGGLDGNWSFQTGDNSYTGGAYSFQHWAVIIVYRDSDSTELADDIINQLEELLYQ